MTQKKQPELNIGDKVFVNIDALSHSHNYYRVELEVIDRQVVGFEIEDGKVLDVECCNQDEGLGMDVAVCRILSWVEFDSDETEQFLAPDAEKVGYIETHVRANGAQWLHTPVLMEVAFAEAN